MPPQGPGTITAAPTQPAEIRARISSSSAPPTPPAMTLGDYLDQQAETLGIPTSLARAIVQQESAGSHRAVSTAGARGLLQLMPDTARQLNVNPDDPFDNIRGGLTYFKQQLDAFGGDVRLALAAYNAGPGRVVGGTVPAIPETQEYVQKILTAWQGGGSATLTPVAARATGQPMAPPPTPRATPLAMTDRPPGWRQADEDLFTRWYARASTQFGLDPNPDDPLQAYNYRHAFKAGAWGDAEGHWPSEFKAADHPNRFVGGMDTATGQPMAVGGRAGAVGPLAGSPGGRASGPGPGPRADLIRADLPSPAGLLAPFDPRTSAGRQNLAATAGSIAMSVATRGLPVGQTVATIARVLAPAIGASTAAAGEVAVEQSLGAEMYANKPNAVIDAGIAQGMVDLGGQALMWPVRRLTRMVMSPSVAQSATETLQAQIKDAKTVGLSTAKKIATRGLAEVEAAGAEQIDLITKQLDDLAQQAPGRVAAGAAVRDAVPAIKQTLDTAGKRVASAAATGPDVSLAPVQETLTAITDAAKPSSLFPRQAAERGAGFLPAGTRAGGTISARPAHAPAATTRMSREEFQAFLTEQLQTPASERLPLTGILQTVAQAPESIPFKDAHALKLLLDERVTWDRPAKAVNERLTKATRQALRATMTGHEEYDIATAAYASIVQLQRKGVGAKILKLSRTPGGADQLANLLTSGNAESAQVLKSLLIDQAAAGGDAIGGQRAWDAVRAVYTYDHLVTGGADGLKKRLSALAVEQPDFARVVYGDTTGSRVLTNLGSIADALDTAKATIATATQQQKVAGAAGMETARAGVKQLEDTAARFAKTKLGRTIRPSGEEGVASDIVRGVALGPTSYWGALSLFRLLHRTPAANEILEWAAYSNHNTNAVVRTLMGYGTPAVMSQILRGSGQATTDQQTPEITPVPLASH